MWKELLALFRKDSLFHEAFEECMIMLRESLGMFRDATASFRREGTPDTDIYSRDRRLNKFQRSVRRNIVTHLAISANPDVNGALVLTAVVVDIERIGDYTKNIVELAAAHPRVFDGGQLQGNIIGIERTVERIFEDLVPALEESDQDLARKVISNHQMVAEEVDELMEDLIAGKVLSEDSGEAVTAALYLRYLKRISAHLKNVATGVVNPYYRIGFREKKNPGDEPARIEDDAEE